MQRVDYANLGMRIRLARKAKGWSQDDLAKRCGISMSFLGHLERGAKAMSLDTFIHICMALHVDASELLWGVAHSSNARLAEMWESEKGNGPKKIDSYSTYIQVMQSVAGIMKEA